VKRTLGFLFLTSLCLIAQDQTAPSGQPRDDQGFLPVASPTNAKPAKIEAPLPARTEAAPAVTAPAAPEPSAPVAVSPAAESPALGAYVLDDKHKLLPGDRVGFQILEDRTNSIPMLVAESSELDLPYLGRVSVAGKTCKQAAADIKAMLEKDYYYKATVIIGLDALTKVLGRVYVFGPVRNPGPVEIPANENFTASKAIVRVGGFGDFANRKKVQVVRKTDTGNKTFVVNMENVLEKGKTEEDITLEPEDLIIVPQRAFNF
jgi:polysaccharide export outer membrane protein